MKSLRLLPLAAVLIAASGAFTACINGNDDNTDYTQWRSLNIKYLDSVEEAVAPDGGLEYTRIVPSTAPATFILMKWHNDRALTLSGLMPLGNSKVDVKYHGRLVSGMPFDSSYNKRSHGDSIYRTTPLSNVVGFGSALMNMHEGDSVTVMMPYQAGYGNVATGKIPPFSTLIFDIKLKKVYTYEIP